mmetsp:Transcript_2310/g.5408  ORF Transcript_2310/g.5408 Transcript_2310/m.5408 type:complete len:215 (-) Transcript_2310:38-682(-)
MIDKAMSSNNNVVSFVGAVQRMCKKYTLQSCMYQTGIQDASDVFPSSVKRRLSEVSKDLDRLTQLVGFENSSFNAMRHMECFEYVFISQMLVLAWKSTAFVSEVVSYLQKRILCDGSWLCMLPGDTETVPMCLRGYRLYCRIAEESIDLVSQAMRMQWPGDQSDESMLMLMDTKVDGEREALGDWLKVLHKDMEATVHTAEQKLTLLSFPAEWE